MSGLHRGLGQEKVLQRPQHREGMVLTGPEGADPVCPEGKMVEPDGVWTSDQNMPSIGGDV